MVKYILRAFLGCFLTLASINSAHADWQNLSSSNGQIYSEKDPGIPPATVPPEAPGYVEFQQASQAAAAGDYDTAVAKFQEAAKQGCALADVYLGEMYLQGDGVRRNEEEGLRWMDEGIN